MNPIPFSTIKLKPFPKNSLNASNLTYFQSLDGYER